MSPEGTPRPFNPQSQDAMFATILARMSEQDNQLAKILAHAEKTNGRVTALEQWRAIVKTKVALVSGGISAAIGFMGWWLGRPPG
jgi:hypothetical protein